MNLSTSIFMLVLVFMGFPATSATGPYQQGEPKLPVIDQNACPFEGCTFREWRVTKESTLYSTWENMRTVLGKLKPGQKVVGLTGVHLTIKPDKILVKEAVPSLSAKPGDIILRYMYIGEGFANIWASGRWYKEYDCSFITETDGSGCAKGCRAVVIEDGIREWWVQVKTSNGQTGWALDVDNFDGMDVLG